MIDTFALKSILVDRRCVVDERCVLHHLAVGYLHLYFGASVGAYVGKKLGNLCAVGERLGVEYACAHKVYCKVYRVEIGKYFCVRLQAERCYGRVGVEHLDVIAVVIYLDGIAAVARCKEATNMIAIRAYAVNFLVILYTGVIFQTANLATIS